MKKNSFYITTPIYYVNDVPHIGHAYTTIASDVLARYYRQEGREVFLLTGTDEHGAKIMEAAKKAGKNPQEFVDLLVPKFKNAWQSLNINYDGFIRTTNPSHKEIVVDFVKKIQKKGFLEKRKYEGLYCIGCEKFVSEEELEGGRCPFHSEPLIIHSEENYFFLLSKLQDKLLEAIENNKLEISPKSKKNEILGKIKSGLEDVSISRESVDWGIEFPGDESQTVYVWVDALINYYSATRIFKDLQWPADIHLIGKDILWFHAVIWPAILLATGEDLPKKVFAHGFFTIGGKKMSKSLNNAIEPIVLSEKYGSDAVRYAILREFPFGEDGDISEEKIEKRYHNDLGNNLGNLLQRTLTMINKYDVKIKKQKDLNCGGGCAIGVHIENLEFNKALERLWECIATQNKLIDEKKPWELAKDGKKEDLREVLQKIYDFLVIFSIKIYPFLPETSEKIKNQLNSLRPEPLFPRLEQ